MRKYGLFLIILVLINLISAFTFSPSQQTGVRVAVLNESQEGTPGSTSGGGGGGGSSDKSGLEGLSEKELCRSSWECNEWNECESFQRSRVCIDENECILPAIKIETGFCISELISEKEPVTGFPYWILLLIALLLIVIAIKLLNKKKKKLREKIKKRMQA